MSEQEQNRKINQHQRLITNLRERLKNVEADVEPDGRISDAFNNSIGYAGVSPASLSFNSMENHLDDIEQKLTKRLDDHDKKLDRIQHKMTQLGSKLDIIIEHLTGINDLPEE